MDDKYRRLDTVLSSPRLLTSVFAHFPRLVVRYSIYYLIRCVAYVYLHHGSEALAGIVICPWADYLSRSGSSISVSTCWWSIGPGRVKYSSRGGHNSTWFMGFPGDSQRAGTSPSFWPLNTFRPQFVGGHTLNGFRKGHQARTQIRGTVLAVGILKVPRGGWSTVKGALVRVLNRVFPLATSIGIPPWGFKLGP